MSDLPEVKYGDKPPADWRELESPEDPDDELIQTPDDVTDILGFDPAEVDEAEDEELEAKRPKSEVNYEHPAQGPDHCSQCVHFEPEHACELVDGQIEPEDWCRLFELDSLAEDKEVSPFDQSALDVGWEEEQHPRDERGRFSAKEAESFFKPRLSTELSSMEHYFRPHETGQYARKFSTAQKEALKFYQQVGGFRKINGELRSGRVSEETKSLVRTIDSAFESSAAVLPKDVPTFRMFSVPEQKFKEWVNKFNAGERVVLSDSGYLSTSQAPGYFRGMTKEQGHVQLTARIVIPAGNRALKVDDITRKSSTEVVLPRNARLELVSLAMGIPHFAVLPEETAKDAMAADADWKESKHPRDKGGKFSTVAGGGGGSETESDASRAGVPSKDKQKEAVAGVTDYLSMIRQNFPTQAGPNSNYGIQLGSGKQFFADDRTFGGPHGRPHQCYANASRAAMDDPNKTYVEGYVTVHGVPIEHAWTVDKQGNVMDPTIRDPKGIGGYYGVPIKTDYLVATMLRTKVFGVFGFHNREIYDAPPRAYVASVPGEAADKDTSPKRIEPSESPAYFLLEGHSTPSVTEFMKTLKQSQRRYLSGAEAKLAAANPTDGLVVNGGHRQEDGTWTPARQELHAQIIRKILTPEKVRAARPEAGKDPVFTMIGGRAGSGKSFVTREGGPVDTSKNLVIDNDEIKKQLPEYEGWNAAMVHEEAGFIAERVINMARQLKLNVVLDGTMKSLAPAQERLEQFKGAGYKLHGYYVFAPPAVAARRAVDRAVRTSRYVSPAYVLGSTTNERSFDGLRSYFHRWQVYDSTEPGTTTPKLRFYGGPEHE